MSPRRWLRTALLVATPMPLAAQAKPDWAAFDKYVAKAAADWRIPALAIAVVKDDSVVFAKGYGVLQTGTSQPANEHTRFAIGSTTKAMTSASIAMLVDEGKLKLDDPVTKYIPELQLSDPWVTRELTIRDLLTHRSGLPGADLFWASSWKYSQAEIIRRLRYIQPTSSFRSEWQYHNVLYALNGVIIERVSGMPWEQFVKTRIFVPLGMNETEALNSTIAGKPNVAVPHALINDSVAVVPVRSTDPVASAGSVWSSVSDMAKWVRFVIDSGRVGNKRLIQQRTFAELVTPQIQAPMEQYPALQLAKPDFFSYGLGWFIQDYRGQQVWMHTGSINGLCAIIGIQPNKRLGVYVLENLDHAEIRHGLMYSVFDLFENGPRRDWSADLKPIFAARPNATQTARATSPPSLPLERYAGTYVDSAYGNVTVTFHNGALQAAVVTDPAAPLEPVTLEAFRTKPSDGGRPTVLNFIPDASGGVRGVRVASILFARAVPSFSTAQQASRPTPDTAYDPVQALVDRLDLERYKNTIKGLAQFGDRRQGTKRNRDAVDWIEAQLKQYGCENVERITYQYNPPAATAGAGRGRPPVTSPNGRGTPGNGPGGSRIFTDMRERGVNNDSLAQPDPAIRAINMEPSSPGERQQVMCTKVGTKYPNEMYIIGGHMDGIGWGQAVNDDASGSAIVMELARIFSMPDVQTERSIRFALWNNEETGLNGARAYVEQRSPMQGKEDPPGSGKYPEPKWLGMIQHDMMLVDHGPPTADGKLAPNQRPEADINIEFASRSKFGDESMKLAFFWRAANEKFATHYPASVGPHMTNTDSDPFKDLVPSLSLRENERGREIGGNWDPTHHQPTDVLTTFNDKDYMLGLTSAQTTLGALGRLVGAAVRK